MPTYVIDKFKSPYCNTTIYLYVFLDNFYLTDHYYSLETYEIQDIIANLPSIIQSDPLDINTFRTFVMESYKLR